MKRIAIYLGIIALVASCSIQEENFETPTQKDDVIFYASFEQPSEGTRVYVNEDLHLRWNADDRVSIFNKLTYNQQYKFLGETGDNAGGFSEVSGASFVTGNEIPHVVSVYPYQEGTKITEDEVMSLTLPAEQSYAENSFGLGANTMVSVSDNNVLQYKNVGGYLVLKLYGEGVSVSSITLKGNNGEKLAGKASVSMPLDGTPSAEMANDATTEITLTCETPVHLGETEEKSTQFWFVVPPVTFSKGFTVTVSGDGGVFEKSTDKTLTIERNNLSKMSPIDVELSQPLNVIYYTSTDGNIVTPYAPDIFGARLLSNEYCDGVGVLSFDGAVTRIGVLAFSNCNITSISLPESVKRIETGAFSRAKLTSFTLPKTVTSIGSQAFWECGELTSITVEAENPVFDSRGDCNAIIETGNNRLLRGCQNTVIPSSITEIGPEAFSGTTNLVSIDIPNMVTTISNGAFMDCSNLRSIVIPESVTRIGYSAFWHCSELEYCTILGEVKSIEENTFISCSKLLSINIPNSVTSIGDSAFSGCKRLESITIPNSVTSIGASAFYSCGSLSSLTIPHSVISIGDGAFQYCNKLISIDVAQDNPIYDSRNNCNAIIETASNTLILGCLNAFIPDTVNHIGDSAFLGYSIRTIIIPGSVTSIGNNAFQGCRALHIIDIPSSITSIGDWAFYECSLLSSVSIPCSVISIGRSAFDSCIGLLSITVDSNTIPEGASRMFWNTNNCPIYVPAEVIDSYKGAEHWSDYSSRIEAIPFNTPNVSFNDIVSDASSLSAGYEVFFSDLFASIDDGFVSMNVLISSAMRDQYDKDNPNQLFRLSAISQGFKISIGHQGHYSSGFDEFHFVFNEESDIREWSIRCQDSTPFTGEFSVFIPVEFVHDRGVVHSNIKLTFK